MKIIITTVSSTDDGERLSKTLVQNGYSPCVNMIRNVKSIYMWRGNINEDEEVMLLIKTEKPEEVKKFIMENHPYETPEIIDLEATIPESSYKEWFRDYFEASIK